eukprot:XP_011668389.1 PREDICTED: uncharacterized protein LOC589758 [Strongylocentrotus purpuratus]
MSSSLSSSSTKGLLERLADGPVVGDGSMLITLEKRGYVMAGSWTPEATLQYPDAVKQLHREFLRAGADVIQTFTYCATEDNLKMKNEHEKNSNDMKSVSEINHRACDLAREVANEGGALVAGSVSNVNAYRKDGACHGAGKEFVQNEFKKQCDILVKKGVDFLLGELILTNVSILKITPPGHAYLPALAILTATSPGATPTWSPITDILMVQATGRPVSAITSTAHSSNSHQTYSEVWLTSLSVVLQADQEQFRLEAGGDGGTSVRGLTPSGSGDDKACDPISVASYSCFAVRGGAEWVYQSPVPWSVDRTRWAWHPEMGELEMARRADVIGVNCCYDPDTALKTLAMMKEGLEKAGLQRYLMAQPLGYHAQEITDDPRGYSCARVPIP